MKSLSKMTCLLLGALLLLYTWACKKDSETNSPTQINHNLTPPIIQDSLAGSYACAVTYQSIRFVSGGGPYTFDTILGMDTIVFSATPSPLTESGNFMLINGIALNGNTLSQINDTTYVWSSYMGEDGETVKFFQANDSVSITYQQGTGIYNTVYNFYNGHKIH